MFYLQDWLREAVVSRQGNRILKMQILGLSALLCWLTSGQLAIGQTIYVDASFTGKTAPGWVFTHTTGTGSVLTASDTMFPEEQKDTDGQGWLRLTQDIRDQASFVYYDQKIPSSEGFVFSFDFAIWTTGDRNAGDGFTLAIFDPATEHAAGGYVAGLCPALRR